MLWRIRVWIGFPLALLVLVLVACGGTTPKGALGGPIDLRPLLSADVRVRAPVDSDFGKYQTARTQVNVGDPPATVAIAWKYFKDGTRSYLLDVAFQVVTPVEGTELSTSTEGTPLYVGSVEAVRVVITWSRTSALGAQSGSVSGLIVADGRWEFAH
jgi:hypothetical protein